MKRMNVKYTILLINTRNFSSVITNIKTRINNSMRNFLLGKVE